MRDRLFLYAIGVSFVAHIGAVCVIGRTSAARLENESLSKARRYVNVELLPEEAPVQRQPSQPVVLPTQPTNPVVIPTQPDQPLLPNRLPDSSPVIGPRPPRSNGSHGLSHTTAPAGDPGGRAAMGSGSANGDIRGGSGGTTPPGWVPNNDGGAGKGSGRDPGTGTPEPPRNVDPGPGPRPAPNPDPPAPKMVSVKVCDDSGMLPGEHCRGTRTKSFVEGDEPKHICNKCKAPEPVHVSTLADRALPELISRPRLRVPDSVDEGLTLRATVEFYVDTDGGVSGARIAKSSGNSDLDRAIVSNASQGKYKPAVQGGVAQRVRVTLPYKVGT